MSSIPYSIAWAASGTLRAPTAAELATGFQCGPLDPTLFNKLFNDLHVAINKATVACLSALKTDSIVPANGVPLMYYDDTIVPQALNVWDCKANGYVAFALDKAGQPNGTNGVPIANITTTDAWKQPVRVASTANVVINALQTVDGIALADGDRVLLKDQTAPSANGLWIVRAAGAWERTADFDDDIEALGAATSVLEGTANGGLIYHQTKPKPKIGTDPNHWVAFLSMGFASGGAVGQVLKVNATQDGFVFADDGISNANAPLTGLGTSASPLGLDLKTTAPISGAGTAASPIALSLQTTAPISGAGTAASPLMIAQGTTTAQGSARQATAAEQAAGSNVDAYATPDGVKAYVAANSASVPAYRAIGSTFIGYYKNGGNYITPNAGSIITMGGFNSGGFIHMNTPGSSDVNSGTYLFLGVTGSGPAGGGDPSLVMRIA